MKKLLLGLLVSLPIIAGNEHSRTGAPMAGSRGSSHRFAIACDDNTLLEYEIEKLLSKNYGSVQIENVRMKDETGTPLPIKRRAYPVALHEKYKCSVRWHDSQIPYHLDYAAQIAALDRKLAMCGDNNDDKRLKNALNVVRARLVELQQTYNEQNQNFWLLVQHDRDSNVDGFRVFRENVHSDDGEDIPSAPNFEEYAKEHE